MEAIGVSFEVEVIETILATYFRDVYKMLEESGKGKFTFCLTICFFLL